MRSRLLRGLLGLGICLAALPGCTPQVPPPPLTRPPADLEVDPLIVTRIDRTLVEVANDPGDPEKRRALAFAYDANGLDELASTEYAALAKLAPRDPLWPYRAAVCLIDRGKTTEGRDALRVVVERFPDYGPALHRLALMRLSDGDIAGAREALDRCLAVLPSSLPAKVTLADIHLRDGAPELALPLLESVTRADPQDRHARFLLGRTMQRTGGDATVAEVLLDEGAGAVPRTVEDPREQEITRAQTGLSTEMDRGIALMQAGRPGDAARVLTAVLAAHPDEPNVLTNLAQAKSQSGDVDGALATIGRAAEIDPENFRVHLVRGLLELAAGDQAMQGSVAEPSTTNTGLPGSPLPPTPDPNTARTVTDADRASAAEHYRTALASAARAARLGDQEPRTHFTYARAAHRMGQLDTARRALEKARDLTPNDIEIHQFLFEVAYQQEDRAAALAALDRVTELNPQHLVSWVNLVHLRRQDGDLEGAQEALAKAMAIDPAHPRVLDAKVKLDAARASAGSSRNP